MSDSQRIALYQTDIHPCGYVDGRDAVTLFLDPCLVPSVAGVENMAELGFRRSGKHIYKPQCPTCKACIPIRICVGDFLPDRTQRKILHHNRDLVLDYTAPELTLEHYRIYQRYIKTRHRDGDMYPPTARQFQEFLGVDTGYTRFWNMRRKSDKRLLAVAVTDHHPKSLSAVYSFFAPEEAKRSLGTYLILRQIEAAKQAGLPYLYLGYWINGCRKMSYKTHFIPQEQLIDGKWRTLIVKKSPA